MTETNAAVGAGLVSIGTPKNSVLNYETAIKSDKFLVKAHDTTEEVGKAKDIMQRTRPTEVTVHALARAQHAAVGARKAALSYKMPKRRKLC
jgi:hypothetical protein